MKLKTIESIPELKGKRIILRVDFNTPLTDPDTNGDRQVADNTRIKEALPTIKYLTKRGAKIIIITHLGRPDGKIVDSLVVDPLVKELKKLLKKHVEKLDAVTTDTVHKEIEKMRRRGTTNVMVSIDVDVLPSYYTGFEYSILAPSIGQILRLRKNNLEKVLAEFQDGFSKGFEPEELSSYVEMIKNSTLRNRMKFGAGRTTKILGDVQELLPKQDINNATANATLIIIKSFFN